MSQEILNQIAQSLVDGDPDATLSLTQQAMSAGLEPLKIIREGLMPGMNTVGELFGSGEYFLPDLIIAADGMKKAMTVLEPELAARKESVETPGVVVIATVKGDIHEIGKSLVATMLAANGFQVHDLGVDVPITTIIEKVRETNATLLGLSALLTTTMTMQREVVKALKEAGLRDQVKVMVGQPHVGVDVVRGPVLVPGVVGVGQHLVRDFEERVVFDRAVLGLVHQPVFAVAEIRRQLERLPVAADAGADGRRCGLDIREPQQNFTAARVDDADHVDLSLFHKVNAIGQPDVIIADRVDDQFAFPSLR